LLSVSAQLRSGIVSVFPSATCACAMKIRCVWVVVGSICSEGSCRRCWSCPKWHSSWVLLYWSFSIDRVGSVLVWWWEWCRNGFVGRCRCICLRWFSSIALSACLG
jgi:hypothetical protein